MRKWILRIITAIMAICIITGTYFVAKGYFMYRAALEE